ncbi:hypothetical protein [Actinokineospora alba]|uniref:hypothetical protein n=1 Tax=Actinokineospora alba TaxID=504798 RepID=UPI001061012B|nr:hypothetical protein [Actinokineospora alba]
MNTVYITLGVVLIAFAVGGWALLRVFDWMDKREEARYVRDAPTYLLPRTDYSAWPIAGSEDEKAFDGLNSSAHLRVRDHSRTSLARGPHRQASAAGTSKAATNACLDRPRESQAGPELVNSQFRGTL